MSTHYNVQEVAQHITTGSLLLVRGLPGSGKSTFAMEFWTAVTDCLHVEADQYFVDPQTGKYEFVPSAIGLAHTYCQAGAMAAIKNGCTTVVANTFTRMWEMQSYFDLARSHDQEVHVLTMRGNFASIHDVPDEVRARQLKCWELFDGEVLLDTTQYTLQKHTKNY